ncbi:protein FAM210B, mitochondrial isoform X2 [Amyelois transitella]|nr:protein FAM210B, mitochondrial isoform X2 [Amyelois transitella]
MSRFSPQRDRDISGPVIKYHYEKIQHLPKIDITSQPDPYVNKYDCRGALSLSSSMQSNVPSPFSGNHTHLGMPGSQWGQGHKYLSDHLHSAHYLTLRNQYRNKTTSTVITFSTRDMSSKVDPPMSAKEKLKKAVKEYGSTVIVFHVSISILSLGGCYLLISSGVDIVALLKYFNIGEGTVSKVVSSNAGTFVAAYAVHKLLAPVRIAITLTATPFIVRYLRNVGFLKHNLRSGGGK